ncbi:DNA adenine methylase [Viridibacillus arvi]|uniref:DNA adenine methylase n=1 Tax=Viridibacillus arvi TaxID=263475 RepID=UPI0034CD73F0
MTVSLTNIKVTPNNKWFSDKHYLASDIISQIPKHKVYVNVFRGGGHIFSQKQPSKLEVFNDFDNDLVNFLMVARSKEVELLYLLETLSTNRFLCEKWQQETKPEDELKRAAIWYFLMCQRKSSINSNIVSGWSASSLDFATDYQNTIQHLQSFVNRWRNVMIECVDFRRLIDIYDGPDTVFFIDAPYEGEDHLYHGDFSIQDHIDLAKRLRNIQGKAIVTYYECDLVNSLYKDWIRIEKYGGVGSAVNNSEMRKARKELILMNFEEEQLSLF